MAVDLPNRVPHSPTTADRRVSLGILTYQRPETLARTLASIDGLGHRSVAPGWRIDEVLIIDNDREPSAKPLAERLLGEGFTPALHYHHEPIPGLAAARNRALDEASGDVLVFIDDDEIAEPGWPDGLLTTMTATSAELVGGPVRTRFTDTPPRWVGNLFDRDEPADQTAQTWLRSGNLAIDLKAVRDHGIRFDEAFSRTGGEDVAFSWQARVCGLSLMWSATAVVSEFVGPDRTTFSWVSKRARSATANWVRVELRHHPGPTRRLMIAARATARIGQGIGVALLGAATLRSAASARGLVVASRGIGAFQGLMIRADSGEPSAGAR